MNFSSVLIFKVFGESTEEEEMSMASKQHHHAKSCNWHSTE